jgi:hypothetical protein
MRPHDAGRVCVVSCHDRPDHVSAPEWVGPARSRPLHHRGCATPFEGARSRPRRSLRSGRMPSRPIPRLSDPFGSRADGDLLFGRGTSDMKGFLAAGLAALPTMASMDLARLIHLAFSYGGRPAVEVFPISSANCPSFVRSRQARSLGEPRGLWAILALQA